MEQLFLEFVELRWPFDLARVAAAQVLSGAKRPSRPRKQDGADRLLIPAPGQARVQHSKQLRGQSIEACRAVERQHAIAIRDPDLKHFVHGCVSSGRKPHISVAILGTIVHKWQYKAHDLAHTLSPKVEA